MSNKIGFVLGIALGTAFAFLLIWFCFYRHKDIKKIETETNTANSAIVKQYYFPVSSNNWKKAAFHRSEIGYFYFKSDQLTSFLRRSFPNAKIVLRDSEYSFVDSRWFKNTFFPAAVHYINKNNPQSKRFDCDKKSALFVHLAVAAANNSKNYPDCDGITIGEIYFLMGKKKEGHAANLVISRGEKGLVTWAVYDIGFNRQYTLNTAEQSSALFIKF